MTTRLEAAIAELVAALREACVTERQESPPARLLTVDQAAEALGLSRTTVYAEIGAGRLRSVKIGRRRLIADAWIQAFVEAAESES